MLEGLPYTWKTKMLGTICQLSGGYGFPDSFQGSVEGELPFIKVSDMSLPGNERDIVNANNYVSMRIANSMRWKPFPAGAVVFAKVGAALKLNRRRILIKPTLIDNNMMAAIPQGGFDSAFLYHFLCVIDFGDFVQDGALPSVNQEQVGSIKLPDINKDEQRRISEILDTIDEAIQKTEALISKLKAMKQGLLHDLLTRGMDNDGKLRDPKAHLIPFSDVVQVNPKTELYDLNDTTNVSFIPMSDVSESGQWVIRQTRSFKDVRNGYTCFKENDILFAKITPCMENGKGGHAIGLVDGIGFGTTEFHVLRADAEIEPRYIYYWTMTEELRRKAEAQMTGSAGQRRVPSEFFDNFKIPLFPRSEQRKIVEILDAHDARISTEEQYRDKLKLQKKGLMHDLLTGKVRVRT